MLTDPDHPLRCGILALIEAEQHSMTHYQKTGVFQHKIAAARVKIAAYREVLRLLDAPTAPLAGPP